MLRNTLAVLALLALAVPSQAALIATATRIGGVTGGAAFGNPENQAASNLNNLVSGADSLWVSYALGVRSTAGEKLSSFNVNLSTLGPVGGFHQRFTADLDTGLYTVTTPSATNISNGDSHLVVLGSVVAVAPTENMVAKTSDNATTTTGFNTAHLGVVADARLYGIGTTMAGAWGFTAAEQAAQVAGNAMNFAYIVVPRGSENTVNFTILAQAASTNQDGSTGPAATFNVQNFVDAGFGIPEPATFSLIGLALAGFGFIRRR